MEGGGGDRNRRILAAVAAEVSPAAAPAGTDAAALRVSLPSWLMWATPAAFPAMAALMAATAAALFWGIIRM